MRKMTDDKEEFTVEMMVDIKNRIREMLSGISFAESMAVLVLASSENMVRGSPDRDDYNFHADRVHDTLVTMPDIIMGVMDAWSDNSVKH